MKSCIYKGTVGHTRVSPSRNSFRYGLFMMLLDLDELEELFNRYWFWSARKPAVARFRREDHFGDPDVPLADAVRDLVEDKTGRRPDGDIRLLTHLSYFGYCFNPLSVYYCLNRQGELEDVVLEVSNTPWGEQHCYVLDARSNRSERYFNYRFNKTFHVSPFMPMDMEYHCRLTPPGEQLYLSLNNFRDGQKVFGSEVAMERHEITHGSMARALLTDPLMTFRVTALIHWQAIILWLKRTPFYDHPGNLDTNAARRGS